MALGGHPHALTLARLRLRCLHIRQDNVTVEVALVHVLGWSVETRSTVHVTHLRMTLAFLPLKNLVLCNLSVEGNNSKRSNISKFVEFCIKCSEH